MTTTLVIYAIYAAFALLAIVSIIRMIFDKQIDQLLRRYFPNYMARRALRAAQKLEDRLEADRREREAEAERMLDWAFVHPDTPEGRRRLLKERDEVLKRLERANWDVENSTSMLGIVRDAGKKAEYETKLAEARQRQNDEAQKLADLDRVLNPEDVAATQ